MGVKSLERLVIEKMIMIRGWDGNRIYRIYSVEKKTDRWTWTLDYDFLTEYDYRGKCRQCLCCCTEDITLGQLAAIMETWKILNKRRMTDGLPSGSSTGGTGRGKRKRS